jgi:hypothetical protein
MSAPESLIEDNAGTLLTDDLGVLLTLPNPIRKLATVGRAVAQVTGPDRLANVQSSVWPVRSANVQSTTLVRVNTQA